MPGPRTRSLSIKKRAASRNAAAPFSCNSQTRLFVGPPRRLGCQPRSRAAWTAPSREPCSSSPRKISRLRHQAAIGRPSANAAWIRLPLTSHHSPSLLGLGQPVPLLTVTTSRICTAASVEWIILDLLLEHSQTTWGIGELVDEISSPSVVAEALEALQAVGLIERSGAFVRIAPV